MREVCAVQAIDRFYLHAGMDAVFQLPASFDHEETFFAAKSGFLLKSQQMLDARILCAGNCFYTHLLNSYLTRKVLLAIGGMQDIGSGMGSLQGDLTATLGGEILALGTKKEDSHHLR